MTDAHCHVSAGDASVRELLVGRDFVGVHPWASCAPDASPASEVAAWLRERLAADPRLGVGEIGLDRLKAKAIPPQMREVFEAQLRVALEFGRPVVLHGAKCWGEVVREIIELENNRIIELENNRIVELENNRIIELENNRIVELENNRIRESKGEEPARHLRPLSPLSPFLFHGFSRSGGLIPEIVKLNGYVSVGPAVLNDHAVNYRELVKAIPLDRLLVETDRDCAPEEKLNPLTGAPLSIRDVLAKTAEIRGLSPAELEAITDENASRFLRTTPRPANPSGRGADCAERGTLV